jgi:endogenous inhibitor of DNA gyrase (YacG/DUF329 family)
MARCEVVQVQCDRCKRIELRAPAASKDVVPALVLQFAGETVKYMDMCEDCVSACKRIAQDLKEWDREIKAKLGPTVGPNQAPPLQVAPNYTPPQPHSAAGGKR